MGLEQIKVELQEFMGDDAAIANAAWTSSYNKELRDEKIRSSMDIKRIINMLADSGHGVPFESVILRFWIRMPIFTDRQHMTHRIASHNGLSGRYRTMPEDHYELPYNVSDILAKVTDLDVSIIKEKYNDTINVNYDFYKSCLNSLKKAEIEGKINNKEYKRVREVIRGVLPTAGMTERTTIMNLRSFANYQIHRNSPHAQIEIRQVARMMLKEVEKSNVCPITLKALKRNKWLLLPELPNI